MVEHLESVGILGHDETDFAPVFQGPVHVEGLAVMAIAEGFVLDAGIDELGNGETIGRIFDLVGFSLIDDFHIRTS